MSVANLRKALGASALALAVCACGGGGGGVSGVASVPPAPVAPPAPTPPPTFPLVAVDLFPTVPTGPLTTIGLSLSGTAVSPSGFDVTYDAQLNKYLMTLPSLVPGYFYRRSNGDVDPTAFIGTLASADATGAHGNVTIAKPSQLGASYTTFGRYDAGYFAFGSATPAGAVPTGGTATYKAIIDGKSLQMGLIWGSAELRFDFAGGTLTGFIDPVLTDPTGLGFNDTPLGRYTFVNSVFSAGSTSFSTQLSNPNETERGSLNGLFTGPAAQELMGTWTIPYHFMGPQPSEAFGVLIGTRQ